MAKNIDLLFIAKRLKQLLLLHKQLESRLDVLESRLSHAHDAPAPAGGMGNALQAVYRVPTQVTSVSTDHFWGQPLTLTGSYGANAWTLDTNLDALRIELSGVEPAVGNKIEITFVGVTGANLDAFYGSFPGMFWHFGTTAVTLTAGGTSAVSFTINSFTSCVTAYAPSYIGSVTISAASTVAIFYNQDDSQWYVMGGPC